MFLAGNIALLLLLLPPLTGRCVCLVSGDLFQWRRPLCA